MQSLNKWEHIGADLVILLFGNIKTTINGLLKVPNLVLISGKLKEELPHERQLLTFIELWLFLKLFDNRVIHLISKSSHIHFFVHQLKTRHGFLEIKARSTNKFQVA